MKLFALAPMFFGDKFTVAWSGDGADDYETITIKNKDTNEMIVISRHKNRYTDMTNYFATRGSTMSLTEDEVTQRCVNFLMSEVA